MRYGLAALLALGGMVLLWGLCNAPARGDAAPPDAAGSTETTAPASLATVRAALKHYRAAGRARDEWARAKRCLGETPRLGLGKRPDRGASERVWTEAGEQWRRQRLDFARRLDKLVERMTSTKGGGALRWKPLVLWVWRCSDSLANLMCHIAWHESSGSPFRWNAAGSGAFGIWQLLPKPPGVWGPLSQAKAALRKYQDAQRWWGNGLLPWAGCRAFTCSGGCGLY